ncbi:MAG: alpha-E domain-containing protein [Phormidesmis sp.]
MLSRVADAIYWLNRYIERAENVARFVEVNLNLLMDSPVGMAEQWNPLIEVTGDRVLFQKLYGGEATAENVLNFLTFDTRSPNSILSCVRAARENARSVRETISSEMWEQVNAFYLQVEDASEIKTRKDFHGFYSDVKVASHHFAGVTNATQSRNESWHFGQLGQLLERADKTTRILDVKYFVLLPSVDAVGSPIDDLQWIALLKSASAYEMYRKVEHTISPAGVANFLILNPYFPRSIKFCLNRAEYSLNHIANTEQHDNRLASKRSLGRLRAELEYLTLDEIFQQGLHEFLDDMQSKFNEVGNHISKDFMALPLPYVPPEIDSASQSQDQSQSQSQSQSQGQSQSQSQGQSQSQSSTDSSQPTPELQEVL